VLGHLINSTAVEQNKVEHFRSFDQVLFPLSLLASEHSR
jgi:hypothetical protein